MEGVDDKLLINLVRLKPYLYSKADKRYKDLVMKENAWKEIGGTLLATPATCEKVWKSLKDKYSREGKKKKKTVPSGSGVADINKWPWYEDMSFLDSHIQERRRVATEKKLSFSELPSESIIVNDDEMYVSGNASQLQSELSNEQLVTPFSSPEHNDYDSDKNSENNIFSESYVDTILEDHSQSLNGNGNNSRHSDYEMSQNKRKQTPAATRKLVEITNNNTPQNKDNIDLKILLTIETMNQPNSADVTFGQLVARELAERKDEGKKRILKRKIMEMLYSDEYY